MRADVEQDRWPGPQRLRRGYIDNTLINSKRDSHYEYNASNSTDPPQHTLYRFNLPSVPHSLSKTAAVGRRGGKHTYLEMQSDERKH